MAMGILRGWPLGASMRLEEEGGARAEAGEAAGGVEVPPLGWLARDTEDVEARGAMEAAPLPEGVLVREAVEEARVPEGAQDREATRGTSGTDTWMCTGAPRAWPGLLGDAGGGVLAGTDTMKSGSAGSGWVLRRGGQGSMQGVAAEGDATATSVVARERGGHSQRAPSRPHPP